MYRYLALLFIVSICGASVLLENGDFEQDLATGWLQATSGSNTTINRATNYDPDPDYEAYVYKGSGSGYARLYQVIDIPSTDIDFSVDAKLYAWDNHASAWAGSCVLISYLNESNSLLGATRICVQSQGCPWNNSSTHHLINATDSLWHNYAFNIDDELTNLPGVTPSDIKKIQISLLDSTYHC
jgi:hypothetical protein